MLLQLTRMMELPAMGLHNLVQQELAENPALEEMDNRSGLLSTAPQSDAHDRTLTVASPRSPRDVLLSDLRISTPVADHGLATALIDSLDDHGLLREQLDQLAPTLQTTVDDLARLISTLQRIGPPGIAVRSSRECLLAQLAALESEGNGQPLAHAIVERHYEDLAAYRTRQIASKLDMRHTDVEEAIMFIRQRLWPYPFDAFGGAPVDSYRHANRIADVMIVADGEEYRVEVLRSQTRRLRVNPVYLDLDSTNLSPAEHTHVREYLARARTFIHNLQRREETLRRVVEAIVAEQQGFLRDGIRALVPLTRLQIAHLLDVHESTIGRTVAEKYTLLPNRAFWAISDFFAAAQPVQDLLAELIAKEGSPLSDQELADLLAQQGHAIARRTVAKYREQLGIPPHRQRKKR